MRRNRRFALAAALAAAGLVATACGSNSGGGGGNAAGKPLIISDVTGTNWNCQFNPLSTAWPQGGPTETGVIYEPLLFVDGLQTNRAPAPWLATGYKWSPDLKTLTFTIRQGVKFTDGTPMTPADVVFSFDVLNENKALDLWSLWGNVGGPLRGVSSSGNTVTLTFNGPSPTYFYYVADQVPILPKHIWSKIPVKSMATYPDTKPVGTGAYTVGNCNSNVVVYKANPHYWQPGKPAVKTVEWPAYLNNTTGNNAIINGQDAWGGQYIPDVQRVYVAKNPSANVNWAPSITSVTLIINDSLGSSSPLSNVLVRKAMALAINRSEVGKIGETGSETGAFQDGIGLTFRSPSEGWLTPQAKSFYNDYAFNPSEAVKLLVQAGYTKMVGGVRENSAGQKLSFALDNNGGYSDWVVDGSVIASQLSKVGIQVTPNNLSGSAYTSDLTTGKFQLGLDDQTGGPAPYYEFRQWLFSGNIGVTNFERWNNKSTDALLNQYASTNNTATQKQVMYQLENLLLSQVPYIPVLGAVSWDQYNQAEYTGWPTQQNPYAQGQTAYPDWGWDLLHIAPKA